MWRRWKIRNALRRDGFPSWQIKHAMRFFSQGDEAGMIAYCKAVMAEKIDRERAAKQRKWLSPADYQSSSSSSATIAANRP